MRTATWLRTFTLALVLFAAFVVPGAAQEVAAVQVGPPVADVELLGSAVQALRGRVLSVDTTQNLLSLQVSGEVIVVRPPAGQLLPPVGARVEAEGEVPLGAVFAADTLRVLSAP